jgi:hypothetical protein
MSSHVECVTEALVPAPVRFSAWTLRAIQPRGVDGDGSTPSAPGCRQRANGSAKARGQPQAAAESHEDPQVPRRHDRRKGSPSRGCGHSSRFSLSGRHASRCMLHDNDMPLKSCCGGCIHLQPVPDASFAWSGLVGPSHHTSPCIGLCQHGSAPVRSVAFCSS